MDSEISQKRVEEIAASLSLTPLTVGLLPPGEAGMPMLVEDRARLSDWQARGFAGEMSYMNRDAGLLSNTLGLLPGACSIVSFAIFYEGASAPVRPPGFGRVARYAWGRDYHLVLRDRLRAFVASLESCLGRKVKARAWTDAVPLLERAVAARLHLGSFGKNSMLIRRGEGSFFFLGEVVSDVRIEPGAQNNRAEMHCGKCSRCLASCPTEAIVKEHVVDSRRCISYLTIEKRGSLNAWEREAIGEWIFGCDVCQEVCPSNHASSRQECLKSFLKERGCGPLLDIEKVLSLREEVEFNRLFKGLPVLRAKREGLLRNAAVVAANTRACQLGRSLYDAFELDGSPIVRQHCLWALWKLRDSLDRRSFIRIVNKGLRDPSGVVSDEARVLAEDRL